jgi:hypothetical protein
MKKILSMAIIFIATLQVKAQVANKESKPLWAASTVALKLTCDCDPKNILSEVVATEGEGTITIPKTANYTVAIIAPKEVNMASVAKDMAVTLIGIDGKETEVLFNSKGQAKFTNMQAGTYAAKVKPPKGGPGGPSGPPRGKCPPGETPWLGGCIPTVVVNKVEADIYAICCRQGNKACCDMAPKPFTEGAENKVAIKNDINCPSGKYDANGNCIFGTPPPKAASKSFGILSFDAGYLASTNAKNAKESKPLWAGSGVALRVNYRYGGTVGVVGSVGYAGGSRNEENLNEFASTFNTGPWVYKTSGFTKTWSQVNFAAGPSILLGKKYQGELNAVVGVSMGSESNIKIDLYDAAVFYKNVYNAKEKSTKLFWEVGGSYRIVALSNKLGLSLKGSYGANGGTVGVSISSYLGHVTLLR